MEDESNCNNPLDETEEIFSKLEEQVVDVSHNMTLLVVALENKFGLLGDVGGFNSEVGLDKKSRDNEDPKKELKKELEKEQTSSNVIASSQSLFEMEAKVDIKPCQGEIDCLKLNHWVQQLEVYFSVHNIGEEKKIEPCTKLVGNTHEDT
jgi:hypothetical protein